MSHVPKTAIHIYQGEDFSMTAGFKGTDAPDDLVGWKAYMEIRTKKTAATLLVRISTEEDGGITIADDTDIPTFRARIAKAVTRALPVGTHVTDMFAVPPSGGDTFPLFYSDVKVSKRRTIEEGEA